MMRPFILRDDGSDGRTSPGFSARWMAMKPPSTGIVSTLSKPASRNNAATPRAPGYRRIDAGM